MSYLALFQQNGFFFFFCNKTADFIHNMKTKEQECST